MKDWTSVQSLKESTQQSGALTRTKGYTTAGDGGGQATMKVVDGRAP